MGYNKQVSFFLVATALSAASGCAANNPEWLASPTSAFCASGLSGPCIKRFAEKAYTDATAHQAEKQKAAAELSVIASQKEASLAEAVLQTTGEGVKDPDEGQGGSDSETMPKPVLPSQEAGIVVAVHAEPPVDVLPEQPSIEARVDSSESNNAAFETGTKDVHSVGTSVAIPSLAFGVASIGALPVPAAGYESSDIDVQSTQAGSLLNLVDGVSLGEKIAQTEHISDPELKAATIGGLLTLYSRSMTDGQINSALNTLYDIDQAAYTTALIIKLPGLLKMGDLERAKSLRTTLLDSKADSGRPFSMLAYVASCYTMAGMRQDAGEIIREAVTSGMALSVDDRKLIGMAISVANGAYPLMQEFYDYRSDEVRLHAYVTIAVIARQLDRPEVAHRAVGDAVKFIQKSAVKLDRQSALSQILAVTPGLIE